MRKGGVRAAARTGTTKPLSARTEHAQGSEPTPASSRRRIGRPPGIYARGTAMSSNAPRKHHTVSAGYLRRFAAGQQNDVEVHHHLKGVFAEGPGGLGYQLDYWGSEDLSRVVEARFGTIEDDALRLLATNDLAVRWPLRGDDRAALGLFMAAHIVRTLAFSAHMRQLGDLATTETLTETEHELDEAELALYGEALRSPQTHVQGLLRWLRYAASSLCSMHWALVEFDKDSLITGDQPVVLLRPPPGLLSPSTVVEQVLSAANTFEGRFTLDPRRALLMTWRDEDDEPTLRAGHTQACGINCAIKALALEEWYCRPGSRPPFIAPPVLQERTFPIAPDLLPGYTVEHAAMSRRRAAAESIVMKMVDEQSPQLRWVRLRDDTAESAQ
jgi:hypothetical protein